MKPAPPSTRIFGCPARLIAGRGGEAEYYFLQRRRKLLRKLGYYFIFGGS
jgi:hypothetical protein